MLTAKSRDPNLATAASALRDVNLLQGKLPRKRTHSSLHIIRFRYITLYPENGQSDASNSTKVAGLTRKDYFTTGSADAISNLLARYVVRIDSCDSRAGL